MRRLACLLSLLAVPAFAGSHVAGEIVVVDDVTGAQHDPNANSNPLSGGLATTLCAFASQGLYSLYPDDYDGVVMFTTNPMTDPSLSISNTMRGNIVRNSDRGISDSAFVSLGGNPATVYGSPARLGQCVWMGSITQLPNNPDDRWTMSSFGFPLPGGITGIELLGHEYGHHWLLWASYDKADGKGKQYLMRGDSNTDPQAPPQPNGHWNHYADARSVMYGSFVTSKGGRNWELAGGVRKYNEFDQYFMGLRAPAEVSPLTIIEDGSYVGHDVQPLWRTQTYNLVGDPFTVSVDDVIRSLGPRVPSSATSQKCFRVAFVLVTAPGYPATPAWLQRVDAYRQRFATWFDFATDGRGHMDTRLNGPQGCFAPGQDAGVIDPPDAGQPVVDAGAPEFDAGLPEADAGVVEPTDAGEVVAEDAGTPAPAADAGPSKADTLLPMQTGKLKPGCGCGEVALAPWALLGLLTLARVASRRR